MELGDGERKLLESIEHTPMATIVTDARLPDHPIVAVNAAFCALTGYAAAEIMGRNCRFLSGPETEPEAKALLREAIAAGRPALVELTNYRKDGAAFRNAVMIAPVLGEDGEVALFVGSQMDVTRASKPSEPRRSRAEAVVAGLSGRQREVLALMVRGYRNKQMAPQLGIDEKTVKMHRARLLAKLGVPTSADAIRIGVEAGVQHPAR